MPLLTGYFKWIFIITIMVLLASVSSFHSTLFKLRRNPLVSDRRVSKSFHSTLSPSPPRNEDERDKRFHEYVNSRDWESVNTFWASLLNEKRGDWPKFVKGKYKPYVINNIQLLNEAGQKEFKSNSFRYRNRHTYAVHLAYTGHSLHGYQYQKNLPTVEGALSKVLDGHMLWGAGRTDRGVHAVSQIVMFQSGKTHMTEEDWWLKMKEFWPNSKKRKDDIDQLTNPPIRVYDIFRVPREFHPRSKALWRRYLYVFPLGAKKNNTSNNNTAEGEEEVEEVQYDVYKLNQMLSKLVDQELSYHAFSYKEDLRTINTNTNTSKKQEEYNATNSEEVALGDKCILYQAKAYYVDLNAREDLPLAQDSVVHLLQQDLQDVAAATTNQPKGTEAAVEEGESGLHSWQEKEPSNNNSNSNGHAEPHTAHAHHNHHRGKGNQKEKELQGNAICIELVGNRFLRQMVRKLVGTALRESSNLYTTNNTNSTANSNSSIEDRLDDLDLVNHTHNTTVNNTNSDNNSDNSDNSDILTAISHSEDRHLCSRALPPAGLCLAGVGYDYLALAWYKEMPKEQQVALLEKQIALKRQQRYHGQDYFADKTTGREVSLLSPSHKMLKPAAVRARERNQPPIEEP